MLGRYFSEYPDQLQNLEKPLFSNDQDIASDVEHKEAATPFDPLNS